MSETTSGRLCLLCNLRPWTSNAPYCDQCWMEQTDRAYLQYLTSEADRKGLEFPTPPTVAELERSLFRSDA